MNGADEPNQDQAAPVTGTAGTDPAYMRDLTWLAGLSFSGLAAAVFFLAAPGVDLWVASLFTGGDGRFFLAEHPVALWLNDLIDNLAIVMGLAALSGLVYTLWRGRAALGLATRQFAFLTLSLLFGPALLANILFKDNWGRARPRQITDFGGSADFTPPLLMTDQCAKNCSFISGDASMAFAMLALALLVPWRRKLWVRVAIGFGVLIGLTRMVQGAHFFSDVIFAGIFMSLIILTLKMIVLDGRWGIADTVLRRAPELRAPTGKAARLAKGAVLDPAAAWTRKQSPKARYALGFIHDGEEADRRSARFTALPGEGWKRKLWLFFRSGPADFSMKTPERLAHEERKAQKQPEAPAHRQGSASSF